MLLGNLMDESYPLNTIKGKICTKTYIVEFDQRTHYEEFNLKPKLIVWIVGWQSFAIINMDMTKTFEGVFLLALYSYCTFAAYRLGKLYSIKKFRRHLLSMKSHCVLASLFVV